jgi:small subunit ribosomal protein S4
MSDYKRQLLEKQKLRAQYNIREKQLVNAYKKATRLPGKTSDNLIQMLERRLDAFVLRAGFAPTIFSARQYVSHGHFQVNGKKVTIPSYVLSPNDVVSVKPKSQKLIMFANVLDSASPPEYISLAKENWSATLVSMPNVQDIPVICDVLQIVELYSK